MGACAFDIIVDYVDVISSGSVIEIGATRGEGSTYFFMGFLHNSKKHNFSNGKGSNSPLFLININARTITSRSLRSRVK